MLAVPVLVAVAVLGLLRRGVALLQQIRRARGLGIPWTWFPFAEEDPFFLTLCSFPLVQTVVNRWLPPGMADLINDNVMTHHFSVRDRRSKRLGALYVIATPDNLRCHVADAALVNEICSSRHKFPKPLENYGSMTLYGPNVVATEGKEWTRHRRHTVAAFNEKANATVWQETISQTTQMLQHWAEVHIKNPSRRELHVIPKDDLLKLTLNVLCGAGFGVQLPFKATPGATTTDTAMLFRDALEPPPGFSFTLRGVMEYTMGHWNSIFMANSMLPQWVPRWAVPFYHKDFTAYDDLGQYLRSMLARARQCKGLDGRPGSRNVLEGLVRAWNLPADDADDNDTAALNDIEVLGNAHIFMLAHESTGATIRFALVQLALHPEVQQWMYTEIHRVVGSKDPAQWDYHDIYPQLVAPLCVMLETMRLHPPAPVIIKTTGSSSAEICYRGDPVVLPPNCHITLNATSLHYDEAYWGADVARFSPIRWDRRNGDSFLARSGEVHQNNTAAGLEYPTVHKPTRGAYIPFSDGLRACLGRKFAQVEFVALLAVLVNRYEVALAVGPEQDHFACVERAHRALDESVCAALALDMVDDVPLVLRPRSQMSL